MSRLATSFVLGFHGCDKSVGEQVLRGKLTLIHSDKDYDWLGPGVYFWENDPVRAMEWAQDRADRGVYKEPYVIGAVIDLGNCLDLLVRENMDFLRWGYENLKIRRKKAGRKMPRNRDPRSARNGDKLLRELDCAVIRTLHTAIDEQNADSESEVGATFQPFDTVRGLFTEGRPVYRGARFYEHTHTQIAVRTASCIKGVFLPRDLKP